jgi:hypothetical protein
MLISGRDTLTLARPEFGRTRFTPARFPPAVHHGPGHQRPVSSATSACGWRAGLRPDLRPDGNAAAADDHRVAVPAGHRRHRDAVPGDRRAHCALTGLGRGRRRATRRTGLHPRPARPAGPLDVQGSQPVAHRGRITGHLAHELALVPDAVPDAGLVDDPVDQPPVVARAPGPVHRHGLDGTETSYVRRGRCRAHRSPARASRSGPARRPTAQRGDSPDYRPAPLGTPGRPPRALPQPASAWGLSCWPAPG